jgi:2,3-bisphosphoglycerate-independent phosphoglycerate mutase
MSDSKKVCLMILDGWGIGKHDNSDAIYSANTPFMDEIGNVKPHSTLKTYGENVGLPDGQMGNSEVGHMNIGAGRVVYQDLVRVNQAIQNGSFYEQELLLQAMNYAKKENKKLHFMGLVSNGGVHSSQEHLHALIDMAEEHGPDNVFVHAFTDGRDCDPNSGKSFISDLLNHMKGKKAKLASVIGRYFAMDRDKRWERVKLAHNLLTKAEGEQSQDIIATIQNSYNSGVSDEFIKPVSMRNADGTPVAVMSEGDVVICFNFRTDRCREITIALTQKDFPEHDMETLNLKYITMTNYDSTFKGVEVIYEKDNLEMTLGEVVSKAGKKQIRIAETEKYPHVTFFFSGGREEEFDGEKRIMINSPKVPTYDLQPEMSAYEVTAAIITEIKKADTDFICLNFANPDMVGHTGVFEAIKKACETIDECASKVSTACLENGYKVLITADHGNADFAINADGSPNTAHSTNLVPLILLGDEGRQLNDGILADLAPTVLELMGIDKPKQMTGRSLLS